MTRTTVDIMLVLKFNPCYRTTDLLKMSGGRLRMKVVDVMHMDNVRNADKLWLVLRYQFLTRQQLRLLACDFAERALDRIDEPDPRSFEAIRVARLFAVGQASSEELAAAAYAAAADAVAYAAERQWQIERVIAALGGK